MLKYTTPMNAPSCLNSCHGSDSQPLFRGPQLLPQHISTAPPKNRLKGPLHGQQGITQRMIGLLLSPGESSTLLLRFAFIDLYERKMQR